MQINLPVGSFTTGSLSQLRVAASTSTTVVELTSYDPVRLASTMGVSVTLDGL